MKKPNLDPRLGGEKRYADSASAREDSFPTNTAWHTIQEAAKSLPPYPVALQIGEEFKTQHTNISTEHLSLLLTEVSKVALTIDGHAQVSMDIQLKKLNGTHAYYVFLSNPPVTCKNCLELRHTDDLIWAQLCMSKELAHLESMLSLIYEISSSLWVNRTGNLVALAVPLCYKEKTDALCESEIVKAVQKKIDESLHDPNFGVDQLALKTRISRSSLYRHFKKETGLSPHDYIFLQRMQLGWGYVTNTSIPIGEIYTKVGFSSDSYFHQAFKRRYCVHPVAVRRAFALKYKV
jgi:AraC-like DNA-binding protein